MNDGTQGESLIARMLSGDEVARNALIEKAYGRLCKIAARMLHCSYADLSSLHWTQSVANQAVVEFIETWKADPTKLAPNDGGHFLNLLAQRMRWALLEIARQGRVGFGLENIDSSAIGERISEDTHNPEQLAIWTEFHNAVEGLPAQERHVFDLIWYQDLTQEEAACVLGVDQTTVSRRWTMARVMLKKVPGLKDFLLE